jgi:hypothetical protein
LIPFLLSAARTAEFCLEARQAPCFNFLDGWERWPDIRYGGLFLGFCGPSITLLRNS